MNLYLISYLIAIVVALALYNAYLILDTRTPDDTPEDKKIKRQWHAMGAIVFILIAGGAWHIGGWKLAPLTLSLFWLLFAGIVHKVGLKKPFFFVGTSAVTDLVIQFVALHGELQPEFVSRVLKLAAITVSVILFTL